MPSHISFPLLQGEGDYLSILPAEGYNNSANFMHEGLLPILKGNECKHVLICGICHAGSEAVLMSFICLGKLKRVRIIANFLLLPYDSCCLVGENTNARGFPSYAFNFKSILEHKKL